MGPAGLEPAAYCLGGSRSIHLSYGPADVALNLAQSAILFHTRWGDRTQTGY